MRILITGATGSLGQALVARLLTDPQVERIAVFSRDEVKQGDMAERFTDGRLRFLLGDVRDRDRLRQACRGCDAVVGAAALKRIDRTAYDPEEVIKTNLQGVVNTISAAIEVGVRKVVIVSTDKQTHASTVYGGTKFLAEQYAVASNVYGLPVKTAIAAVRYGNVIDSRGAVLYRFRDRVKAGLPLELTDPAMNRFVMTLGQAVDLVLLALAEMRGGEVFVPQIPSMWISDLAAAVAPGHPIEYMGLRPGGEKMSEVLVSEHESHRTVEDTERRLFVIEPSHRFWTYESWPGKALPAGFRYESGTNTQWLDVAEIRALVKGL